MLGTSPMCSNKKATMRKTYDYLFKIVLVGDYGVGKTQILSRFSEDDFNTTFIPTIEADFKIRSIELDGKIVKLQIWDTPSIVRFGSIRHSYYRGAKGIMLIYDICSAKTFDSIAGNHEEIKGFAAEHGMLFMEVSAKLNINIEEALFEMARQIMNKEDVTGSDDCGHEDGSDEYRPGNACVVQ